MDFLMNDIKTYAQNNKVPIIKDDGLLFLLEYIKDNNVESVLEIGTAIGYSAINMALIDENIKITTIERDTNMYNIACKNVREFNKQKQINILFGDALEIEINEKFDLIFIDGAKGKYIEFFLKYSNNLNDTGVIITDNLDFHGFVQNVNMTNNRNTKQLVRKIQKYIDFLKNNSDYNTFFYSIGDGISISKKAG